MIESRQTEVDISGVTARGMQLILDYVYTSQLELNLTNVLDVLSAANYTQMNTIVEACSKYLQSQIDLDNCVDLMKIAETYSLEKLQQCCYRFICLHLKDFSTGNEINQLECHQLEHVLTCEYPVNCTETVVLRFVLLWLKSHGVKDLLLAERLLSHVRLAEISIAALECTMIEFFSLPSFNRLYYATMKMATTQKRVRSIYNSKSLVNFRGMELALVNVGGFRSSAKITNEITYYFPSIKKWDRLTSIPHIEQCNYGTAILANELYVVGGCYNDGPKEFIHNFGFRYNPIMNNWTTIKPMQQDRCRFSLNCVDEFLYAIGGASEHDDSEEIETLNAERYDPNLDCWQYIPSIPENRSQHAGTSYRDTLFISGGLERQRVLSTFWKYDTKSEFWKPLPDMITARADHVMLVIEDKIYVCGGWCEEQLAENRRLVETIDVFDMELNMWKTLTHIPTPKYHAGIVALNKKIYIIGGFLSDSMFNRSSSTVECFDIDRNEWTDLDPYPQNMWEGSCVSLYIPKHREHTNTDI